MVEKLEDLPDISKISANVTRILGQNPGKFTLQGTNTYVIGTQYPYVLVDPGEGKQEYLPLLASALDALSSNTNTLPEVSDIMISHWHSDHVGGLPSVLSLLQSRWQSRNPTTPLSSYLAPKLHKYPLPSDIAGPASTAHNKLPEIIESLPKGAFTPTPDGKPFHDLHDNQLFRASSPAIRVIHSPGHTLDSIALDIPDDHALYTADTVLGQGTAVFEDLRLYLQSLNKLLEYGKKAPEGYQTLYPAHGPIVKSGHELISTYIKHRLDREQQVLEVLRTKPTEGDAWTTWTIVKVLYASYPESLWIPASHSIDLHLKKLQDEGTVVFLGGEGVEKAWKLDCESPSS
ncbi:hypothetical protein AGABI1DRAFT_125618 [Agaricus bisporus var. burnettii JB137-S8]|uniref:Metallo-beta-lactamase domain-containing protein n=1 Tax=Agaricus bisporus var. burnettii (strain JB137-S8 / ATCC MYA-4627 / FGSC 10392) TaxID=597362 RepID=K5X5M2_AGABU|nr:uncharacterized protein AGABI1DRAFT_125618 [Agaricus bisporus var. burnettii JB137-S8]EKM83141.1 hypothetical protein AGABI1DRAFT_125618 [Agaricus bisporus var. burnettii JB137-S8]